jgi:hypothetical protein
MQSRLALAKEVNFIESPCRHRLNVCRTRETTDQGALRQPRSPFTALSPRQVCGTADEKLEAMPGLSPFGVKVESPTSSRRGV